jgi:hypothetical protein
MLDCCRMRNEHIAVLVLEYLGEKVPKVYEIRSLYLYTYDFVTACKQES